MPKDTRDITYVRSKASCGHSQIISYFHDDKPLPVTCCVKCRAGSGIELREQMADHIGMFPARKAA